MRFATFSVDGTPGWGCVTPDGLVDMSRRLAPAFPDLKSYITAGMPEAARFAAVAPDLPLSAVTLAPVIPNPAKIVMAAVNYFEPGEDRSAAPAHPVLFLRLPSSQIGHGVPLIRPAVSEKLDFEGELAVIIGRPGRHIPREAAMTYVAGYAIYNDGSVRDWQKHSHQFTAGKNFTGTGAFGPWMVTPDEFGLGTREISLVTRVNGIEKQSTTLDRMIFDVAHLISYISTFAPLEAGDVIVTGTCRGFGSTRVPPEFLQIGDVVQVAIDGIGVLENRVEAEESGIPVP